MLIGSLVVIVIMLTLVMIILTVKLKNAIIIPLSLHDYLVSLKIKIDYTWA